MKAKVIANLPIAAFCAILGGCADDSKTIGTEIKQIEALRTRLNQIEQQVAIARDASEIKKLQRTYGYYLDRGKADDMADLFTDSNPVAGYESGDFVGKDSIRTAFRYLGRGNQLPTGRMMTHMQVQPVVHVAADGKTALGRFRAVAMTARAGEARIQEGPYESTYVKEDGVWKIQNLHWYETFGVPYFGGWPMIKPPPSERPDPAEIARRAGIPKPDRPEKTATWPQAAVAPYHYKNPVSDR
ncbi:MAG: nuclear transport factor 2 family protein [Pseudomonadota bacterium]